MSTGQEFARGWPVLAAAFLGIAAGVSSLYFYSLGIFIKPMAAEFGWSRGAASLGALVGTAGAALAAIPTGRLVDRLGAKRVGLGSVIVLALGFAMIGWLTVGLASFLFLSFALSLVTAGSSPLSFTRLVVVAFSRARGLALGLTLAGTGIGGILIPALLTPFVATHGWRAGFLVLAVVAGLAVPVLALLLARCEAEVRTPPAGEVPIAVLARSPAFALLAVTFFLAATAVLGTVVQFVPMLTDRGLDAGTAGRLTALIGVAAIGGRIAAGLLLDRVAAPLVTMMLFLLTAIGLTILAIGGIGLAAFGALVTGLAVGAEVDLIAFLVARHFPPTAYGKAYGAIYACFLLGGAIGPALSGALRDATGTYVVSLLCAAGLLAASVLVAARLRHVPAWDDGVPD
ncbi:MAG TPA: MFS transporter [Sphingomonas sp.]